MKTARAASFEAVAREWLAKHANEVTAGTAKRVTDRLQNFMFPYVGKKPVRDIKALDLLTPLKRIESVRQRYRTLQGCGGSDEACDFDG